MKPAAIETLYSLYAADEPMTTTAIAKGVFDPKGTDDLRNADRKVRYYLTEKFDHLLDVEEENGAKQFELKDDVVFFGLGKLDIVTQFGGLLVGLGDGQEVDEGEDLEEVSLGLGAVLVYEDGEDGYSVVNIEVEAVDSETES